MEFIKYDIGVGLMFVGFFMGLIGILMILISSVIIYQYRHFETSVTVDNNKRVRIAGGVLVILAVILGGIFDHLTTEHEWSDGSKK